MTGDQDPEVPPLLLPPISPKPQPMPKRASLLGLPPELRDIIYDFWLADNPAYLREHSQAFSNRTLQDGMGVRKKSLLTVCSQINAELQPRHMASRRRHLSPSPPFSRDVPNRCDTFFFNMGFKRWIAPGILTFIGLASKHVWLCIDDGEGTGGRAPMFLGEPVVLGYEMALRSLEHRLNGISELERFEILWTVTVNRPTPPPVMCGCCKPAEPMKELIKHWEHEPREHIAEKGYLVGWRNGTNAPWEIHFYASHAWINWLTGRVKGLEPEWAVGCRQICFDGAPIFVWV